MNILYLKEVQRKGGRMAKENPEIHLHFWIFIISLDWK
jgi:hypothetical protein